MNKNVKVCILSTVHAAFDDRIFHKQAKTLAQAGYNMIVIAFPQINIHLREGIIKWRIL